MHTWQWETGHGRPYLTCSLLERWPHGFFTQQCWPSSPTELTAVLHPTAQPYRAKQVHGNTILFASDIETVNREVIISQGEGEQSFCENDCLPQADGLLAAQADQSVWVCSADCTPVLIADTGTGQAAAVHAGWRGTAAKIVPQAIAKFQRQGSALADLRIVLGPAIAGAVYQVSTQVAAEVVASVVAHDTDLSPDVMLDRFSQQTNPPVLSDPEPGRMRLDVRRVNTLQLEQLGIASEQIAIAPHCTYQEPERFFSYRRDGLKKVQWYGIVSLVRR